eukprot:TRINITY_DN4227_c0_g1_i1.p1 TRINITY_DN4227_c0_g1~~TRINITY_DN4227_c0_g1_i1.p1  ORF type:complete len:226 (-),score=92.24 TRINITY_DN4227_c0_g1_i1:28-705(-)
MKSATLFVIACLCAVSALLPQISSAAYGVDLSTSTSISDFNCLSQAGDTFAIIRGWLSTGSADPNCPHTIYNAQDGGIKYVDVYLFPCAGNNGESQLREMVKYLVSYNATWGTIWIDVETNSDSACAWSSNLETNCKYLSSMISEAKQLGAPLGIYASEHMWSLIAGSSCTVGADAGLPLWYAHYDGNPSFSDFTAFGGWNKPAIKQYAGTTSKCGVSVDLNYYP